MLANLPEAIGLANYVFGVVAGLIFVFAIALRLIRRPCAAEDERIFLRGVLLLAGGWSLHQSYWLVWRTLFNMEYFDAALIMANRSWLVTPAYALIGYGSLVAVCVVTNLHNRVPPSYIAGGVGLWLSGVAVGLVIH